MVDLLAEQKEKANCGYFDYLSITG